MFTQSKRIADVFHVLFFFCFGLLHENGCPSSAVHHFSTPGLSDLGHHVPGRDLEDQAIGEPTPMKGLFLSFSYWAVRLDQFLTRFGGWTQTEAADVIA